MKIKNIASLLVTLCILQAATAKAVLYNLNITGKSQFGQDGRLVKTSYNNKSILEKVAADRGVNPSTLALVLDDAPVNQNEADAIVWVVSKTDVDNRTEIFRLDFGRSIEHDRGTHGQAFLYPGFGFDAIGSVVFDVKPLPNDIDKIKGTFHLVQEATEADPRMVITGKFTSGSPFVETVPPGPMN